jgi:DNA-directed RNA polymerase subunit RPC12/RpoP
MLTDNERSRLVGFCSSHAVAFCHACERHFRLGELFEDPIERHHRCPRCGADLNASLANHIRTCPRYATPKSA